MRLAGALFLTLFLVSHELQNAFCAECGTEPIDFHFLLDASGSILEENFESIKNFVIGFVDAFEIGSDQALFGVSTFATNPQNQFWMNTYATKANIQSAIAAIPYSRGDTLTEKALSFVRLQAFTAEHGDRPDAMNVLIVITDGKSSEPAITKVSANLLHQTDIAVLAVGLETGSNDGELAAIATDPTRIFTIANWDALTYIQEELQTKSCEEPPPPEPVVGCPSYWDNTNAVVVDGKCVRLFNGPLQWQQAQDACAAEGTGVTLLDVTSETLFQYVASEAAAAGSKVYLGASDLALEGTWTWTNGDSLATSSPWWGNGQPDNFNNSEHCLIIRQDGKFNDYICNAGLPYFCQAP